MGSSVDEMYDISLKWVKEAGDLIKTKMNEDFKINTKSNTNDLVTDVDTAVESFFQEKLQDRFPTHRLMGEEGSFKNIKDLSGTVWILDPIDGTINFVHQKQLFSISLGIFVEGVGVIGFVYDVMKDELFSAVKGKGAYLNASALPPLSNDTPFHESIIAINPRWLVRQADMLDLVKEVRGIRCYGSAALEITYVAAGRLDGYVSFHLSPWDIAGGCIILKEVGGRATNNEGKELTFLQADTFVAANPNIHDKLISKYFATK